MRSGMYYAIGLLLLLVTVPMYRYILHRANRPDPVFSSVTDRVYIAPQPALLSHSEPLATDELCEAGVVVRVRGNAYTQELTRSGSVHCAAGLKFN